MEYSHLFVCLMGMGTVFFGLVCLVALSYLLSAVCRDKTKTETLPPADAGPAVNRQEMTAAIAAALAEELGADITGIRIHSIKKI